MSMTGEDLMPATIDPRDATLSATLPTDDEA